MALNADMQVWHLCASSCEETLLLLPWEQCFHPAVILTVHCEPLRQDTGFCNQQLKPEWWGWQMLWALLASPVTISTSACWQQQIVSDALCCISESAKRLLLWCPTSPQPGWDSERYLHICVHPPDFLNLTQQSHVYSLVPRLCSATAERHSCGALVD